MGNGATNLIHFDHSINDHQADSPHANSAHRAKSFERGRAERDGSRDSIGAKRYLSDLHWKMLNEESGILPDVIFERPYETIDAERQRALGFPVTPEQASTESLLIRLHGLSEEVPTQYQIRPNVPRTLKDSNGKPRVVKYEGQPRKQPILDVHPRSRELLKEIKTSLWVGEGVRKGDSGVSRGLCVINLSGVWAWLHNKVALPDWRLVPLKNRQVYICFDSDALIKRGVGLAVRELGGFLELHGATVKVIDWEAGFNG
jgi:hypothetical protein